MAHKLIILGIVLALLSSSCKAPAAYLPEAGEIGASEFGSYIILNLSEGSGIEGELIAIENEMLIVLSEVNDQMQTILIEDINSFKLMYAQPKNYGLAIPASVLLTLTHGNFALFTAPVNIAVTGIITTRGTRAFTYNEKTITWEDLKMFARFPQGLPPNIELADLE